MLRNIQFDFAVRNYTLELEWNKFCGVGGEFQLILLVFNSLKCGESLIFGKNGNRTQNVGKEKFAVSRS